MTVSNDGHLDAITASVARLGTALERLAIASTGSLGSETKERLERELRQARAVGEFAVLAALSKLKNSAADAQVSPAGDRSPEPEPVPPTPSFLEDYDTLTASQILPLLANLTTEQKDLVRTYEAATRRRPRVLDALA